MGFKVKFPLEEIKAKLKATQRQIEQGKHDLLEAVGVKLLSLSQQAYRVKSRGGTGSDGITWKSLAASTIKSKGRRGKRNEKRKTTKGGKARPGKGSSAIGIDTGLQLASASPGNAGNILSIDVASVTVGYGREYSGYFDEVRPLLPTTLPDKWEDDLEQLVVRGVAQIIHEGLK